MKIKVEMHFSFDLARASTYRNRNDLFSRVCWECMGHFGEELTKEREAHGVSLKQIADATKISIRHLVAVEQEQFGLLPGGVFNKGIVRSYARVVGLDEDEWVARYLSTYQQSGAISDDDLSWFAFAENVGKARAEQRDRPAERLRWAGVLVLLTVLAVVAYFAYGYVHQRVIAMPVHAAEQSLILPLDFLALRNTIVPRAKPTRLA